jgi:heat shock protein HslJ
VLLLAALASALILFGQVPPEGTLQSTVWRWVHSVVDDNTFVAPIDRDRYTIAFNTDGTFNARADCNLVNGTYRQVGRRLSLQLGASTLAACPPGSRADEFLQQLGSVSSQASTETVLVLNLSLDSGSMIFEAQPSIALTGTSWLVQSYNNGAGGVTTLLPDTELTAAFGTDGTISGSAGCNTYSGTYTVEGTSISIGEVATTLRACAEDVMEQEQAYLAALQASTQFQLTPDRLTLRNDAGATQVNMVPPAE